MYLSDIKPAGIKAVEFHYDITENTLADTRRLIDDFAYRAEIIEHNYQVGLDHFSYKRLEQVLSEALKRLNNL